MEPQQIQPTPTPNPAPQGSAPQPDAYQPQQQPAAVAPQAQAQSQMQPQPQPAAGPQPLFQSAIWYRKQGSPTVFQTRKSIVTVYPGWLLVHDEATREEVFRSPLTPDLKMRQLLGWTFLKQVNGQKAGMFKYTHQFAFYNEQYVGYYAIVCLLVMFTLSIRIANFMLVGLIFFLIPGASQAKAFVAACKQAAGQSA